jgi:hypothetical protein
MSYFPGIKIWDETASNFKGLKFSDGKPRFISQRYGWAISEGDVAGHSAFLKLGFNPDVDNTSEDVWDVGGNYVFPAAAIQMEVVSSSASDDGAPAGTGVQKVRIYYLTNTFVEANEEVILNGTGAVNTVAVNIYRVNYFVATAVGTAGSAVGNVDLRAVGGATTYARISIGHTRSRSAVYTVPTAKSLFIAQITASSGVAGAANWIRFTLRATYDDIAVASRTFMLPHFEVVTQGGPISISLEFIEKFPAGTDLKVSAIGDSASTNGACCVGLRGWLE